MFSPDMTGTPHPSAYPSPGAIQDMRDHPGMDMPEPGHSPAMEHSTQMAGDEVGIPSSLPNPFDSMGPMPKETSKPSRKPRKPK